jgi:ABC-type multidrug transport system fused ATPase/permease subunit
MNRFVIATNSEILKKSLQILSKNDRKKFYLVAVVQVALGLMDLIGVGLVGVLGALAITGLESGAPGNRVSAMLRLLNLDNTSFQSQVTIIGTLAAVLLISRTLVSIYLTKKVISFLTLRGAQVSSDLTSKFLSRNIEQINSKTTEEVVFGVTSGVSSLTLQVLAPAVALLADFSLLLVLAVGLFIVDPSMAVGTILLFFFTGFAVYKLSHKRTAILGNVEAELTIASMQKINEVLSFYRQAIVANRLEFYSRVISSLRFKMAKATAELTFAPFIGKYVLETTVIFGALLVGGVQFLQHDASRAVATITVFMAAGTRIAPAVLRVQQSLVQIKSGYSRASETFLLIEKLRDATPLPKTVDLPKFTYSDFSPSIEVRGVSYRYPGSNMKVIDDLSISIEPGSSLAITGKSGVGKSTLVDLILGVLEPTTGNIRISNETPRAASIKWAGAIAYVPQDTPLIEGTIRENVSVGYPLESATDERIMECLEFAQLGDLVRAQSLGIDSPIGSKGIRLSGGQRQRLGIARAFFTQPTLVVFDEATSSLDNETEEFITGAIESLKGRITVITIAHRHSTILKSNSMLILKEDNGVIFGPTSEVFPKI